MTKHELAVLYLVVFVLLAAVSGGFTDAFLTNTESVEMTFTAGNLETGNRCAGNVGAGNAGNVGAGNAGNVGAGNAGNMCGGGGAGNIVAPNSLDARASARTVRRGRRRKSD